MMKPSPPNRPVITCCWKWMPIGTPSRRAQEGILLADQRAAEVAEPHRQDVARIGRGERDLRLAAADVREHGREQALAGDEPLARRHQLAEEPALLVRDWRRRRRSSSRWSAP